MIYEARQITRGLPFAASGLSFQVELLMCFHDLEGGGLFAKFHKRSPISDSCYILKYYYYVVYNALPCIMTSGPLLSVTHTINY